MKLLNDLRLRLLNGPARGAIASLRQTQLQARTSDTRVDTLVELFVSQFEAESSLESFLQHNGYLAWEATLLPGMGYGENVFVIPVINECELKGNCFVFHNTTEPLSEHRLDYYSYEYTDVGYRVGAQFMSDEELSALYMVAGGQATSQYVLLGTVDTAAVLFRHYVDEAGGLTAALSARTTSCSVLYCDDLETTLPPDFSDNGNPNTGGGGGGGGGGWPHTGSPGDPEWHSGGWIFYGPGSSGGSGGGGFQWPTIKWPNFGGGGSGGSIWNKVRRFFGLCYQFREGPAVGDRYHDLAVEASVSARTGNCEWIQIHGVEDVSMYTYLGNTQLGEEWGIDINEFECRGIAFGNEAMSIDFAFGIRHILATYEEIDWQIVKCLAENPELAAVANAALEEFAGSSTCSGVSIEDYVEDKMHSFCASGTDSEDAASALHRDLEREEWIDYSGYNLSEAAIQHADQIQNTFEACLATREVIFLLNNAPVPTFLDDIDYFDWLIDLVVTTGNQIAFDILRQILITMPQAAAANYLDSKISDPNSDAYTISLALFLEFALGVGPERRTFEEDHPFTQSLINSNFTCLALAAWYAGYQEVIDPNNSRDVYPPNYRVDFPDLSGAFPYVHPNNTGPVREAFADGGYTTSQFTGTANFIFSYDEVSEDLFINVVDSKSVYSLLLHLVDDHHTRDQFQLFGQTLQNYVFDVSLSEIELLIHECQ